jgi:glycosyltransferase involved in cell wall biosynthesis
MKRRLLFLGRGGAIDGQQRQLLYLCEGLIRHGKAPVVVLDNPGAVYDELVRIGAQVHVARMSSWRAFLRIARRYQDARGLLGLARRYDVDIVHAHDVWHAGYARFIARRLKIAYIVHVRGPLSQHDIRKHRLARANAVIAIARRYVDDLVDGGVPRGRIHLVDDAVDLAMFDPVATQQNHRSIPDRSRVVIGFVGRICANKMVREFLGIIAGLPLEARARCRVVIAGERSEPRYAETVTAMIGAHGLTDDVQFAGRVPASMMPDFLAGIDLLVTLSGGSAMFEAMAMGKPVLSIREDGRHSVHTPHEETALCVDTFDPSACTQELARLIIDDELRHRLGRAARARVESSLSLETMLKKTVDVYDRLAVTKVL